MTSTSALLFAATLLSSTLAVAVLFRRQRTVASVCFFAGTVIFALEGLFEGIALEGTVPDQVIFWQTFSLFAGSFLPGTWLLFSLCYSRENYRDFLRLWRAVLIAAFLLPIGTAFGFPEKLIEGFKRHGPHEPAWFGFGEGARALNFFTLIAVVMVLMHLEKTLRSSVGAVRWRIKFLVLGLAIIFGARIYTLSQELLFSGQSTVLMEINSGALLLGSVFMAIAYLRRDFNQIDVHPSHAVIHGSLTLLLAGGYLFVVGVLAQGVALLGGAGSFQFQAFLVLLGIAVLGILLFSERLRLLAQRFVSRHFQRPQYDFRKVWTSMTQRMSTARDKTKLCTEAVRMTSTTFSALSVMIWLLDEKTGKFILSASTSNRQSPVSGSLAYLSALGLAPPSPSIRQYADPFDLDAIEEEWAESFRKVIPVQFSHGGKRICVPLSAGNRWLGLLCLADRVNGVPYTIEELDLLKCIGDQVAAALLNFSLTEELMTAKEMEAFQTMSAFFIHDLKNAASSLDLMLQNLPVHFHDPEFRQDALRGIGTTVNRINQVIGRLSMLRGKLDIKPVPSDLNQLIAEAVEGLSLVPGVALVKALQPLPEILADKEQIQNVVTNLLLNARDVVGSEGEIRVETTQQNGRAILSVADTGSGMNPTFIRDSLFRPFRTTKEKGLGIGLFQSRMIVEAHRGKIQVECEAGKGTIFRVILPLNPYEFT
jgi:putative PEP-CTERM system histidine kinase